MRLTHIKTLIFTLLLWHIAPAQTNSADEFSTLPRESISLKGEPKETIKLDFSAIQVLDARPDTSSVGFAGTVMNPSKLTFTEPAEALLERLIIRHFTVNENPESSPGILLVLKKLWITSGGNGSKQFLLNNQENELILKMELYTKSIYGFKPLIRVDTTISVAGLARMNLEKGIAREIVNCLKQAFASKPKVSTKAEIKLADIHAFNNSRFDFRILKTSVPTKGVYKTFGEFQNNNPSYQEFSIGSGALDDIIYIKDNNGFDFPARNVWGYCDGKDIYIRMSENFFKLNTAGSTFNVFAAKSVVRKSREKLENLLLMGAIGAGTGIATGSGSRRTSYNIVPKPYQLDMLSGELF